MEPVQKRSRVEDPNDSFEEDEIVPGPSDVAVSIFTQRQQLSSQRLVTTQAFTNPPIVQPMQTFAQSQFPPQSDRRHLTPRRRHMQSFRTSTEQDDSVRPGTLIMLRKQLEVRERDIDKMQQQHSKKESEHQRTIQTVRQQYENKVRGLEEALASKNRDLMSLSCRQAGGNNTTLADPFNTTTAAGPSALVKKPVDLRRVGGGAASARFNYWGAGGAANSSVFHHDHHGDATFPQLSSQMMNVARDINVGSNCVNLDIPAATPIPRIQMADAENQTESVPRFKLESSGEVLMLERLLEGASLLPAERFDWPAVERQARSPHLMLALSCLPEALQSQ